MQRRTFLTLAAGLPLRGQDPDRARAAYLAICLGLASALKGAHAAQWSQAIESLSGHPRVLQVMFSEAPFPAGDRIRESAVAAGLAKPAARTRCSAREARG